MTTAGLPLIKAFPADLFPIDRLDLGPDVLGVLSKILVTSFDEEDFAPNPGERFAVGLTVAEELVLDLVGLDGFAIVIGGASVSSITFGMSMYQDRWTASIGAGARLRVPRSMLKPVRNDDGVWVDDESRAFAEVQVSAGILIDNDWNVTFDGANAFQLQPAMVADSGVVLEGEIALDFSETTGLPESAALGLPTSWRGVVFKTLTVHLPPAVSEVVPIANLQFTNFHIGSGGVTGSVALNGVPGAGTLGGFPFQPTALAIELKQNSLVHAEIAGTLTLAFFDRPLNVVAGFDLSGGFTVGLSAAQPAGTGYNNGLVTIDKPGICQLVLESLRFTFDDGKFTVALSGELTPLVGGLDWPGFRVQELSIDSDGNVKLEGGWLELREQYTLAFYGFQLEIAKLGFGTAEDGRRWIGFSGGLKLVDGLSAGASVEGLRLLWDPATNATALTLSGVGVEFEVPNVVYFKGAIAMTEPAPGVVRFDGAITLSLLAMGLEIEAQLVIGYDSVKDATFFAIYLGVELPAGIPLWTTGLGLYGIAGLFALQMEPDKHADEAWYAIQPAPSWYHRGTVGVTDLGKWRNQEGSLALGAGATIGTVVDNGFSFAGRFLLGIVFPGPILFLEGRANILKERASLRAEPMFRALVVLDARAGSFLVGLDAQYKIDSSGALIDIGGGAEAFFDFHDASKWHLYLGVDEPRERRIRAEIFQRIFEANAYFMLDAHRLRTGAWIGYDKSWTFGPLKVSLEAWIEGGATLSSKPVYLHGYLWLHGHISAKIFGFGFGLGADARFDAGVFDPFSVRAELSISVDLPWPLGEAEAEIVLEWGPDPEPPLLPAPLKEVSIDHLKVTTAWPLPIGGLLSPDPDPDGDGFFRDPVPAAPASNTRPPNDAPVVPLDARPRLTFGRSVNDDALVGVNPSAVFPNASPDPGWEWIGDPDRNEGPARARTALKEIVLERWTGSAWVPVASKGPGANASGVSSLFGSWAPLPQLPSGVVSPGTSPPTANVKLWLWSRSPFDFTRRTGGSWEEWFADQFPDYPCVPIPADRKVCCDFSDLTPGTTPPSPWVCPEHPNVTVGWLSPPAPVVVATKDNTNKLCFPPGGKATIRVGTAVKTVTIRIAGSDRADSAEADGAGGDKRTHADEPSCIDVRRYKKARGKAPFRQGAYTFVVFDSNDNALPDVEIRHWNTAQGMIAGIDAGWRTEITLAEPATSVHLTLTALSRQARAVALDRAGRPIAGTAMRGPIGTPEVIALEAPQGGAITSIQIQAPGNELAIHRICGFSGKQRLMRATTFDRRGTKIASHDPVDGVITVPGREVREIHVDSDKGFCIETICWIEGLSEAERSYREELRRHIETQTSRWQEEGAVLAPFTNFRLRITTTVAVRDFAFDAGFNVVREIVQAAYFRTVGPPGLTTLSIPKGHPLEGAAAPNGGGDPPSFDSGLDDLTRYVAQTVPPTVPPAGEPPLLPRPVYRAYDVGVKFNEDYVEQMYRMSGRDLGLYLFDANGLPARDSRGRLLTPVNRWGRVPALSLSASDERWLLQVDGASCLPSLDQDLIPRALTLASDGQVLDPDTLHEGRLIPLLVHDTFASYAVGTVASGTGAVLSHGMHTWLISDNGADGAPSRWVTRSTGSPASFSIEQTSDISLGAAARQTDFPGGTFLVRGAPASLSANSPDHPSQWTDYRVSVFVRSSDDDLIGVAVRFDQQSGYLVHLDAQLNRMRAVLLQNGAATLLAETAGGYLPNRDVELTVEIVGDRLRAFVDGEPILDVTDATLSKGSAALFAGASAGATFTDFRIDDLRATAPVVYRFAFATSGFVDFRHHMLSYRDETWATTIANAASLNAALAAATVPATAMPQVGEAEARAFADVAITALGTGALQPVSEVEVTRIGEGGQERAILVRTAEPVDWRRTELVLSRAAGQSLQPTPPLAVRIAAAGFPDDGSANSESVTLLRRHPGSLEGYRIEKRTVRSATSPNVLDGDALFAGDMTTDAVEGAVITQRLWQPRLRNLSEFTPLPVDNGTPPSWEGLAGALTQMSFVGRPQGPGRPKRPAYAWVTGGDATWTDYRINVSFEAATVGGVGVVFRFLDQQNHYRIEFDRTRGRTSLVARVADVDIELWVTTTSYVTGQPHSLVIDIDGSSISAVFDGTSLFNLFDQSLSQGCIGFLTLGGPKVRFFGIRVESLVRPLSQYVIEDFGPAVARSRWQVANRRLKQDRDVLGTAGPLSNIGGSVALAHNAASWIDTRIATQVNVAAAGAAGVVFRWKSVIDHYRLVIDLSAGGIRLVRVAAGVATTLWSASSAAVSGMLRVEVIGSRIRAWLDGTRLCDVHDSTHIAGGAGPLAVRGVTSEWRTFSVVHAEPQWEPWYSITDDEHLVSGSRVTVLAGRAADATSTAPAGEKRIFIGTAAGAFAPSFPSQGIDLRILDPIGHVGHTTRVLHDSAFSALAAARVVRAADGTGFVLLVPDGVTSLIAEGQYRFAFTFRRDNTARDSDSLVLSREGDTSDEDVVIDVPWTTRG